MGESYLGVIQALGFQFAPRGWGYCGGDLIAVSQNTALFSLLGPTYGGDGRTTFALPDLRGRTPMGQFQGPGLTNRVIGQKLGVEETQLTQGQMPEHTHAHTYSGGRTPTARLYVSTALGTKSTPDDGDMIGVPAAGTSPSGNLYVPAAAAGDTVALGGLEVSGGFDSDEFVIQPSGHVPPTPVSVMQPSLVVNFCICTVGNYPARS